MWMECDTDEERLELWQAIMEYGLFWKEPPKKFKRDFVNIRFILKRSRGISDIRSEVWKLWGAPKGNQNAVKTWEIDIKQPKQAKQPKTTKTSESDSHSLSITSYKKEERNIKKEEMLEAFRNDPRLNKTIREEDVAIWLDYKFDKKQPYKTARSFCTLLVSTIKEISFWQVRLDLDKRFSYAVDIAIASWWDGFHWYDWMEANYLKSKRDLFPMQTEDE